MQNNAVQSEYMRTGRRELKEVFPRRLIQDFPEEPSFEVRSIRSAQCLSPELACRKKAAWAWTGGLGLTT